MRTSSGDLIQGPNLTAVISPDGKRLMYQVRNGTSPFSSLNALWNNPSPAFWQEATAPSSPSFPLTANGSASLPIKA